MSKDIPIIFSAPMIRALLEGRKTQTRRIFKPPAPFDVGDDITVPLATGEFEPRYQVGDRLWVRETVRGKPDDAGFDGIEYLADGLRCAIPDAKTPDQDDRFLELFYYRNQRAAPVPSIHMPRWASRLTLIVTGVKVERLQDISQQDVFAEGLQNKEQGEYEAAARRPLSAAECFAALWKSLHGPDAWDQNPFVVAITFRVIKANIDAPEARAAA